MANPFGKLPAGAPINSFSITAWNRMLDMLNWWQSSQARFGGGPIRNLADYNQGVFLIKNTTNYDIDAFTCLGVDGPLYSPTDNLNEFKNITPLKGVEPAAADHKGKFAVALESIGSGKLGMACVAGVTPVRVYVTSESDKFCDVIEVQTVETEDCYLGSGSSGAQIFWWEPDDSESDLSGTIVWAVVRLGESPSQQTGARFRNDSSEEVPPCAIMAVTGVELDESGAPFYTIDKPSDTFRRQYVVNDAVAVPAIDAEAGTDGMGSCFDGKNAEPVKVLYDELVYDDDLEEDVAATPAFGNCYGPKSGQWSVKRGYPTTCVVRSLVDEESKIILADIKPIERQCVMLSVQSPYRKSDNTTQTYVKPGDELRVKLAPYYPSACDPLGIIDLSASWDAYDKPVLRIDDDGLWEVTVNLQTNPGNDTSILPPLTSGQTGVTDSHQHSYQVANYNTYYQWPSVSVSLNLYTWEDGAINRGVGLCSYTNYFWGSKNGTVSYTRITKLRAGTEIVAAITCSTNTPANERQMAFSGSVVFRRVGDFTEF